MSFSFFKPSRTRSGPVELASGIKDSLLALDTKIVAKALEEVEKNVLSMKQMLCGDGEAEASKDQVFDANPHKPREILEVLARNRRELLMLLNNLPMSKGGEDEQLEEEKDLIIKEIEKVSQLADAIS